MLDARTQRRQQLRANGYMPLPLFGKAPPLKDWQKLTLISRDMITLWSKVWPDAINTGVLTRYMPALDIDILNEEAARAIEELTREKYRKGDGFSCASDNRRNARSCFVRSHRSARSLPT
jgi:Bifunctional DNA primase/polymerase, N-terminal